VLLIPTDAFAQAGLLNLAAAALGVLLVTLEIRNREPRKTAKTGGTA
jgi:hypothetical protein